MLLQDTIGIYPNAFSSEFCDTILKAYDRALLTNQVYQGSSASGVQKNIKNSKDYNLLLARNVYPDLKKVCDEVCNIFNTHVQKYVNNFPHQDQFSGMTNFIEPTTFEILQIQRYTKNEGHYNAWHHESGTFTMSRRYFALLVYLNDVQEGGETEFLYTGQKVKPEKGKLLLHPAGFPYVHRGNMPVSEDKTILISWLSFVNNNR